MLKRKASCSPYRRHKLDPSINSKVSLSCDADELDVKVKHDHSSQEFDNDTAYVWRSRSGTESNLQLGSVNILERAVTDADTIPKAFVDNLGEHRLKSLETESPSIHHQLMQACT